MNQYDAAMKALRSMNYYRLTGYSYQFIRGGGNSYRPGTSFDVVLSLYLFDKEFRRILHARLEELEIYARTQIAYYFSHVYGSGAHYNPVYFQTRTYHDEFIATLNGQIEKNKDAPFVAHHILKYGGKMPIWCAVEVMSFSTLSKFFSNLNSEGRTYIAAKMGFEEGYVVNWLHCFAVLRNTCAHYGRVYNNMMKPSIKLGPRTYRAYSQIRSDTVFAYIVAMCRFFADGREKFVEEIIEVVSRWTHVLELGLLGFPTDWEKLLQDTRLLNPISKPPAAPILK